MTEDVTNRKMVAGFLFSGTRVLLVQKQRPEWQKNLWNGVGGVVEPEETPLAAMNREFCEETRCKMSIGWRHFCTEAEPFGSYVHFFCAHLSFHHVWPHANDVGEVLLWFNVHDASITTHGIGNLKWLIPMALDPRRLDPVVVAARGDIRERASW